MYEHLPKRQGDYMSDLLWCCGDVSLARWRRARFVLICVGEACEHTVSVVPGATTFTRTPAPATSSAADFVSPSTACC